MTQPDERPVVASYCATFLKPEMLHIYRQITSLRRLRPIVIAQKRENADRFPFDDLHVLPKPPMHFLRRFWYRQVRDVPWQISQPEVKALLAMLTAQRAELLHVYFGHIAVHLLPLVRLWKKPSVVSFHGADVTVDLHKPGYRSATLQMLNAVRLVLVRSDSLSHALQSMGCPADKIRVQRTGVPTDEIEFRPRIPPTDARWRLVQAGRLVEKKGIGTTLRAFAQLKAQFPRAQLTIAGEGPLQHDLEQLARDLHVAERVRFAGFLSQPQLRELFYSAHIFIHPSETGRDGNQEGVPNSMLEAMATGLPVFATKHGGIPEVIEDGSNGVLVAERDGDALACRLADALHHPESLSRIAQAGRRTVEEKFNQQDQTRALEQIYLDTINHGRLVG